MNQAQTCYSCPLVKDPMRMSLMILYAVVIDAVRGICILKDPSSAMITSTSILSQMFPSHWASGVIYLASSALASFALFGPPKKWKLFLTFFQQGLLVQSAIGAIRCIVAGTFADGVHRNSYFLMADQSGIVIITLLHSFALIRMGTRIYTIAFMERAMKKSSDMDYDNS